MKLRKTNNIDVVKKLSILLWL